MTGDASSFAAKVERDPIVFARAFLHKYFYLPFAPFQKDMVRKLVNSKKQINVVFVPRGFGKSTIVTLLFALWYAVFKGTRYILLISQSQAKATQLIEDIQGAVQLPGFFDVFGNLMGDKWSARRAHLYSERFGINCTIEAIGVLAQTRGLKVDGMRPELAFIDDVEDDEDVENPDLVAKTYRWFYKKLLPALREDESIGESGKVYWLATTIANDSASIRVAEDKDAEHRVMCLRYPALVTSGRKDDTADLGLPVGNSIWEEKMSTKKLHELRDTLLKQGIGTVWYNEYMLDPRSDEEIVFQEKHIRWFAEDEIIGMQIPLYCTIDSGYEERRDSDKSAIVIGGMNARREIYIFECIEGKWSPQSFLNRLVVVLEKYRQMGRPIIKVALESVAYHMFELVMKEELWTKNSFDLSISRLQHKKMSKFDRIRGLVPYNEAGHLFLKKGLTNLFEQMVRFPSTKDGIDGLDAAGYLPGLVHAPAEIEKTEALPIDSTTRSIRERLDRERRAAEERRLRAARGGYYV